MLGLSGQLEEFSVEPECIFTVDEDEECIDGSELELLLDPHGALRDLKCVVIGTAGRHWRGHRFLMSFMVKYLRTGGTGEWYSKDIINIEGFLTDDYPEPPAPSVVVWPEVFKMRGCYGKDVAVVLIAAEGLFADRDSAEQSGDMFCYTSMLSSLLLYNLQHHLRGPDLRLFLDLAEIAPESASETKPGQELLFVIRDWPYSPHYTFGWKGGHTVLEEELLKDSQKQLVKEFAQIGRSIKATFVAARCYLMPDPCSNFEAIIEADRYDRPKDRTLRPDFVAHVRVLIESIFEGENLVPKKIDGEDMTLGMFFVKVDEYRRVFQREDSTGLLSTDMPNKMQCCGCC